MARSVKNFKQLFAFLLLTQMVMGCGTDPAPSNENIPVPRKFAKKLCKVSVVYDTTYTNNCFYVPILGHKDSMVEFVWKADTVKAQYFLPQYVMSGEYDLGIQSIFKKMKIHHVLILNDTTIYISKDKMSDFTVTDSLDEFKLSENDSLQIMYEASGCFHESWETIIFHRNKDKIGISYSDTEHPLWHKKEFFRDPSVLLNVEELYRSCVKFSLAGVYAMSTSSQRLFIFKNDKVYYFTDQGSMNWRGFEEFKGQIGL